MDLLSTINACLLDNNQEEPKTLLGTQLLRVASEIKDKFSNDPVALSEFEDRIRTLREAEEQDNFAWMNMRSWYQTSPHFRKEFTTQIDPLIWGGVYFTYSEFEECVVSLSGHMDKGAVIFIAKGKGSYQFLSSSQYKGFYDCMTDTQFFRYKKGLTLIKAIDCNGVREYEF